MKVLKGEKFDHRNKDLEAELKKSRHRMKNVRNGNGILSVFSSPESRRGNDSFLLRPKLAKIDTSEPVQEAPDVMNASLQEKLDFYDDSPRAA